MDPNRTTKTRASAGPAPKPATKRVAGRTGASRRLSVSGDKPEHALASAIGGNVRRLRRDAGLTLEDLARRSGVSRAMISKVERGEKSPTLAVVARIARGLNTSLSLLMGGEAEPADVILIPAARQLAFRDPETGFERRVLSPTHLDNGLEFLLHRIPPGKSSGDLLPYTVPAVKFLVVHEGRLTVYIDDRVCALETGDALYFEAKAPYRFVNEGKEECAYYVVIHRQR